MMAAMTPRTSHRSHGLYRVLERPVVYDRFQKLFGGGDARRRFAREFVQPFAGARILDIGCGSGMLLDHLPGDVDYVGFDMNPSYVEAARARYGDRGRFFCARVGDETGTIAEDAFDIVVARGVLHHLDDGAADHLIASARRYLKPGGVFVSVDPVFTERQPWVSRILMSLDRGGDVRTEQGYRRLLEPHFSAMQTWTLTSFSRLPYHHFVARARRTPAESL